MKTHLIHCCILLGVALTVLPATAASPFADPSADRDALPAVPPELEVSFFAREPMVRNPCSIAFDERGRMFVSHGPQ